jgi:hypothetical protein
MTNWTEKTVWTCSEETFSIEVTHHLPIATELDKWTITAFIYPNHPTFDAIDDNLFDLDTIPTKTFNHPTLHNNYDLEQVVSIGISGYRVFNSDWNLVQQNREMFKDAKTIVKWLKDAK